MNRSDRHRGLQAFYEEEYYAEAEENRRTSRHLRRLARQLVYNADMDVLDVACGTGEWLRAAADRGARVAGIDIAAKAVAIATRSIPEGRFVTGVAEALPWSDRSFDLVTCLGALEHFPDKDSALREMHRVVRGHGRVLVLVPNAGFLTRRLGLFRGTEQIAVLEDVLSLDAWKTLFEVNGFHVERRWSDLHVLNRDWLMRRGWPGVLPRLFQALALAVWPLNWQYQVYHLLAPASDD
jgi:SAM-dependent methyltransferase